MKKIFKLNFTSFKRETLVSAFKHSFLILATVAVLAGCGKNDDGPSDEEEEPEVIVDNDITPLTKKIMDGSTVIATFVSDVTLPVAAGMNQTQITFKKADGLPVKIFVLEADMKTPKLELQGMAPYNEYITGLQKISEMCRDNQISGTSIVAAINGDVYNTASGLPASKFYINNRAYSNSATAGRTYIAQLNDGSLVIGGKDTKGVERPVDLAQIKNAVGGNQWLVDNTEKATLTDVTILPRTTIGFTSNKVIYAVIVDGSQPDYSNGLALVDVRDIMSALGVKDAINLDGAASTTFVAKDNSSGPWTVQNKPSGVLNTERLVGNGLAFVLKN